MPLYSLIELLEREAKLTAVIINLNEFNAVSLGRGTQRNMSVKYLFGWKVA